jgi:hypothetical protein
MFLLARPSIRRKIPAALVALGLVALAGCATRARPGEMSAIGHEEAAEKEKRAAAEHDPCSAGRVTSSAPCWSAEGKARSDALEHEALATEHQHAAELKAAEERACASVAPADRLRSPFSHSVDILSVQALVAKSADGKTREAGAVIVFRKVPGLTAEVLGQIIDCHLARNAALGTDRTDLEYCPLTVNPLGFKTLRTKVIERPEGLAVILQTNDESVAHEVLRRAQRASGPARCLATPAVAET